MKKFITIIFLSLSLTLMAQESESSTPKVFGTVAETAINIANQFPDYKATPGDIYEITFLVSGSELQTINGFVDLNYSIDLSFIGKVDVKGLNYSEVQEKLKAVMLEAYPGSIINVTIKAPGKFKVTIIGEVNSAQIIEAYSINTLAEVISGKTTKYASFRDIEIRSEDGTVKTYDLFQYQRYADQSNNPFLNPNDVITIRPYKKAVTIAGEVKRPGVYQLLEGETLYDLVNIMAEGFTKVADKSKLELQSIINTDNEFDGDVKYINAETRDLNQIKLADFDKITVGSRIQQMSKLIIQGAVTPARYNTAADGTRVLDTSSLDSSLGTSVSNRLTVPFVKGSRLSTVLSQMDGTFNLASSVEDAFILRKGEKIEVDIMQGSGSNSNNNFIVEDGDMLVVPFKQQIVYVAGSANSTGAKPFIANRTADYYIGLAGGYKRTENLFGSYVIHDVYGNKRPKDSIIEPEDVIWVRRNHPMSYITEYSGWITTIVSVAILAFELDGYYNFIGD